MIDFCAELTGENLELARAEAFSVVRFVGGSPVKRATPDFPRLQFFSVPTLSSAQTIARRLALARRCLTIWPQSDESDLRKRLVLEGRKKQSAAFRRFAAVPGSVAPGILRTLVETYKAEGGTINLTRPERRFWMLPDTRDVIRLAEEIPGIDGAAIARRAMPKMPFQRPISMPPRLARATVNLAGVGPGDYVVDPFLGTGALLSEAALLGSRVTGVDRDAVMIKGALRNFTQLGVTAEELLVGDAEEVAHRWAAPRWDAVVTDPPYGRASSSGGEATDQLLARVLPAWAELVRPSGRIVVVVPGGPDPLPYPWVREISVSHRVHRSLTREFRVYRRSLQA